jgi:hypothetical protein
MEAPEEEVPALPRLFDSAWWEEDAVDDVDDAIGGFDVDGDDGGIVDHDGVAINGDGYFGTVNGGGALAVHGDDLAGRYFTGDDVVGEYRGEQFGVA